MGRGQGALLRVRISFIGETRALGGTLENDDVTQLEVLSQLTGVPAPAPLAALAGKTPRFDRVVDKADILSTVGLLKDL